MERQEQPGPVAPANAPNRRPVVLPETFNGEGDWSDWFEHFESVAAVNHWKDDEKLLWLRVRLIGRAATAFKRIDDGMKDSYAGSVAALKERFDPGSRRELYLAELMARKKRHNEEWASFAEDLKRLVERAYPELPDNAREQIALANYLGQLDQPQLSFSVKQRRPKSVDEAVRTTLEMASYLRTPHSAPQESVDIPSAVATVKKQPTESQDSVMPLLQQIMSRIDSLEARVDRLAQEQGKDLVPHQPQPRKNNKEQPFPTREPVKCHRCRKPGHLARGCAAPRSQLKTTSGNGRPPM